MHLLTRYRKSQKPPMSQAELARRLGISRSYVKRIEDYERHPSIGLLRTIKAELGIAPHALRPDLAADAALFTEAAE